MCIILACKDGARPTPQTLATCWANNPDGAGYMYAEGGVVHGRKGYMRYDDLAAALESVPEEATLVVHFRIATSGGVDERVTHPFPVSRKLKMLHATEWTAAAGIAHNGVLHGYEAFECAGVSDTIAFIKKVAKPTAAALSAHGLTSSKAKKKLAAKSKGSRLAVLDGEGRLRLIGDGWTVVAPNISASNTSWRQLKPWATYAALDSWAAYEDGLPSACGTCTERGYCATSCPLCYDVAQNLGYTIPEIDKSWDKFYLT